MNDQERITDFLCSEKKMSANYDTYASECVNVALRDAFLNIFNQMALVENVKKSIS